MEDVNSNNGHWERTGERDSNSFGFVYRIANKTSGKFYLGSKQYYSKVTKRPLKGTRGKRRTVKESDWREYASSSESLRKEIITLGKEAFRFEILSEHPDRQSLRYAEIKLQIEENVLFRPDSYNQYIGGRFGVRK